MCPAWRGGKERHIYPTMHSHQHRIIPMAADGWRFVLPLLAVALIFLVFQLWWVGVFFVVLAFFVGMFFRDFDRPAVKDPALLLAPADGKVGFIDEIEVEGPDGQMLTCQRISIVLTIFDVHVQRSPAWGRVSSVKYNPGKFLNAVTNDKSSDENEHNMIWIESHSGMIGVKQIAGMVARRVLSWVKSGENVKMGQRIGLIRFGSRVEAFLPPEAMLKVEVGDRVYGGKSILGELPRQHTPDEESVDE